RRNPHRTGRPSPVQDPSAETWLTRPQPPETEQLAVNVAHLTDHGTLTDVQAAATYTVPVAVFIACVWLLHRRSAQLPTKADVLPPVAALAVLATTFTTIAVLCTGVIASLLIGASLVVAHREAHAP
ncbi:hypothetical protein ABZZ74_41665, partial [Streptomyces sp. NPDC006476]